MNKGTVLVTGSNGTRLELQGGGFTDVGQYLNELVVPSMALVDAGFELVLATPDGTKPQIAEVSDSAEHFRGDEAIYARAKSFYADHPSMNQVRTLRSVIHDGLDGYAGLFTPGGHAPIVDLMQEPEMGAILRHFHEAGKPTALMCHGPIALVSAMPHTREFRAALVAGDEAKAKEMAKGWTYAGYKMTVFSSTEEEWAEKGFLRGKLTFHMPKALQLAGGEVMINPKDFEPFLVMDRELITGQNPNSDREIGAALIKALGDVEARAAA